jgi:hypothetical protein
MFFQQFRNQLFFLLPPSIFFLIALISGILLQEHYCFATQTFVCITTIYLGGCYLLRRYAQNYLYHWLPVIVCIIGGYSYKHSIDNFDKFFATHENIVYQVIGKIVDKNFQKGSRHPYIFTIVATQLIDQKNKHNINKKILVYTHYCDYTIGDTIIIKNVKFKKPNNDEFVQYLQKQGISATLFVTPEKLTCVYRPMYSIRRWVHNMREQLYKRITQSLSRTSRALISALFFGNRSNDKKICDKVSHYFKQWGIAHYFARSGLHLVLFVIFLQWVVSLLPLYLLVKEFLLLLLVFIYFLMSWASLSFIRALTTLFVYKAHVINKRAFSSVSALICVAFFTLLYNPHYLFFLDFQLSFFLTFNVLLLVRMF